jgi:hypothetical protein
VALEYSLKPPFADRTLAELKWLAEEYRAKAFVASTDEMQRALIAVAEDLERMAEERKASEPTSGRHVPPAHVKQKRMRRVPR